MTASSNAAENGTNHRSFPDVPAQTLQQDFFARQQWPSYQEMLVRAARSTASAAPRLTLDAALAATEYVADRCIPLRARGSYPEQSGHRAVRRDWLVSDALSKCCDSAANLTMQRQVDSTPRISSRKRAAEREAREDLLY